ncbi:MAG TPA: regulatory protein RecX [Ktedonobacterales bacterium]
MRTITALDPSPRRPDWWHISIDGAYAFSLDGATVITEGLMPGLSLTDEDVRRLRLLAEESRLMDAALGFLTVRPRSRAEVRRRLLTPRRNRPAPPAEAVDRVLDRLAEKKLLDDREFADYWVEQRERFSPRSSYALAQELRQRGVDRDTADSVVDAERDSQRAMDAARQRLRALGNADYETFRAKLTAFLQRRGFSYGIARETVRALWEETRGSQPDADDIMDDGGE